MLQHTKGSTKQYSKLPSSLADEIPRNKLCLDLMGTYYQEHRKPLRQYRDTGIVVFYALDKIT